MNKARYNKPNVLWIFGDQHRSQALSCHGDPNVKTPNLDNLAALGVDFPNAVAGMPLSCPFRGTLLTGLYPHHCVPGHEYPLPKDQKTIAHIMNEEGYHSAYFGKWHLGGIKEAGQRSCWATVDPSLRGGFQHWIGFDNNNSQWDTWVHGHKRSGEEVEHYLLEGYETDVLTDMTIEYISNHVGARSANEKKESDYEPFFAVLSVQPPHDPYLAPAEFRRLNPQDLKLRPNVPEIPGLTEKWRNNLAGYYGQIENLDWNVGRIIDKLRELDIYKETHILFFSDHGDMHGSQGHTHKMSPHEESIRIPFIMAGEMERYLDRRTENVDVPINGVDIAPTTLGLCGIPVPNWMEGTDFSAYKYRNKPVPDVKESYIQSVVPTGHAPSIDPPWRGIVDSDGWKYVCTSYGPMMLVNNREDPHDMRNLAHVAGYRDKLHEMHGRLASWIKKTGDDFQLPELFIPGSIT
jgi:arylsulfatase A-like enzyme